MALGKISLRIYLPHLLENKEAFKFLTTTYEELRNPTSLYLWYDEKKDSRNSSTQPVLQATWEQIKRTRGYFHRYPQIAKFFMARFFYMLADFFDFYL